MTKILDKISQMKNSITTKSLYANHFNHCSFNSKFICIWNKFIVNVNMDMGKHLKIILSRNGQIDRNPFLRKIQSFHWNYFWHRKVGTRIIFDNISKWIHYKSSYKQHSQFRNQNSITFFQCLILHF